MLSQKMHIKMTEGEGRLELAVVVADQRRTLARSTRLFHILVLIVKRRSVETLRLLGQRDRHGYDAYTQLVAVRKPRSSDAIDGSLIKCAESCDLF